MLNIDLNNILSVGEYENEGKEFTRSFFGYPIMAYDHTILVYTKKGFEQKQWKDVGSGQSILQLRIQKLEIHSDFNKGLARLGFDLLYKYDDTKGECINIAKVDDIVEQFANTAFGSSRSALVMPSYDKCLEKEAISSFLFGIAIAHGKWSIKNDVLSPVKINIPLTSSLLGKKDFFEKLTSMLHSLQIIHTVQFLHTGTYEVMQLTLHDSTLLNQFVQWLNPIVKITKISTLDYAQKVYDELLKYVSEQGLELPIISTNELIVLEAD